MGNGCGRAMEERESREKLVVEDGEREREREACIYIVLFKSFKLM